MWDYDAQEPTALVDAAWQGRPRKLLVQANRNGFFYVLDRTDGTFLFGTQYVKNVTWASGLTPEGRPIRVPTWSRRSTANASARRSTARPTGIPTSFNPATGLYYVQTNDKCGIFTRTPMEWEAGKGFMGGSFRQAPDEPAQRVLRAIDIQTGKAAWELPQTGAVNSWGGTLSTAGGVVIFGEDSGALMAADAANGKPLWSFQTSQLWKASPMTYLLRQQTVRRRRRRVEHHRLRARGVEAPAATPERGHGDPSEGVCASGGTAARRRRARRLSDVRESTWIVAHDGSCRLVALAGAVALSQTARPRGAGNASEWGAYAGDNGGTKYSPLDQINKDTVKNLRIAWRQSAVPGELATLGAKVRPANFENTPVMIGGLLYLGTALGTVAALDPATGKVVWLEELPPDAALTPTSALGAGARGVAHWSDGGAGRILSLRGRWLVALDAKTGKRIAQFGDGGQVDLATGYDRAARSYSWRSIPVVVRDVIVVGGLSGAGPASGDVRGFDVRTGKQLWTFHVIPRPGEFGNDSWLKDSWEQGTAAGVWGLMSADEELGYVYLPTESSASRGGGDYYGAHRPGDGLFAESLVCLDARTGKRVWHFQMVHHGLWDFDLGAAPNLVDITVDGRRIKAVAQVSKQNFVYVFDRACGNGKIGSNGRQTVPGQCSLHR